MTNTRNSLEDIWGPRTGYLGSWPMRADERTTAEPENWVPSVCVLCSTGCALDIGIKDRRIVGVRGRAEDRVNRGRLGPKGLYGWEANHSADRLTQPLIRRRDHLEAASWDEAMDLIVARTHDIKDRFSAGAIGFYNSGQLCLEEYFTLMLVAVLGVGTPHLDGNTRLCTATAALALIESFGTDGAPGSFSDFDSTEAILLMGHSRQSSSSSTRGAPRRQPRPMSIWPHDSGRTSRS